MKKTTFTKYARMLIVTWFVNAGVFISTLFIWTYTRDIAHWSNSAWQIMFAYSSITKIIVTFMLAIGLPMMWDTAVPKSEKVKEKGND